MIDTSLTSSNFYFLLAVIQGFMLSIFVIFHKGAKKPSIFLGVLIFLFSLSLLHMVLEESIHIFNARFPIPMDFSSAYGPLAYFHILYIKSPARPFRAKDFLHFLPAILFDGIYFSALFIYLRNHMDWAMEHIPLIQAMGLSMAILGVIQLSIYIYFMYKESLHVSILVKEFEPVRRWLRALIMTWCTLVGFILLVAPIALWFIEDFDDHDFLIYKPMGALVGISINVLGYLYLLKYSQAVDLYTDRVQKFQFSQVELNEKKAQILAALREDKLYQDSELTVAKFAEHLNWPINDLSRIINESLGTNFNHLINQHRVEAFKVLAKDPVNRKYSIMGLGEEVGFRSKASFYRAFKQETGMTPSEFIKSQPDVSSKSS
ncbi:MAG: helix-turn-helix domain-containing protein [Bacteroidota bacterium]